MRRFLCTGRRIATRTAWAVIAIAIGTAFALLNRGAEWEVR